jgi:hypothetical protein
MTSSPPQRVYPLNIVIEKVIRQASDLLKRQVCVGGVEVIIVVPVVNPAMSIVTGAGYDQA